MPVQTGSLSRSHLRGVGRRVPHRHANAMRVCPRSEVLEPQAHRQREALGRLPFILSVDRDGLIVHPVPSYLVLLVITVRSAHQDIGIRIEANGVWLARIAPAP